MPFTLVGFSEDSARDGLTAIAALADEHVTVVLDDITVPILNKILAVKFFSPSIVGAQLRSPSLRRLFHPDIMPVEQYPYQSDQDRGFHNLVENPIELEVSEKINALINSSAVTKRGLCLLWLGDGTPVPAKGQIRTLRCTATGGSASNAWTNQALTLTQTLPAGRYAVVGMHVLPANSSVMQAIRLVFVGGTWRPGIMGGHSIYDIRPPMFRNGGLGVWGEFEFDQPPTIDYLTNGATGALQVFLDLIQIRSGR